jgi:hypothetical protein
MTLLLGLSSRFELVYAYQVEGESFVKRLGCALADFVDEI